MKIAKWIANLTLWCSIAGACGAQIGYHQGYSHGVRDIGTLLMVLSGAAESPPGAPSKRGIAWGTP